MVVLNRQQTKEYISRVLHKCQNSWELYDAGKFVLSSVLQSLMEYDMLYNEFCNENVEEIGMSDIAKEMFGDWNVVSDEDTQKVLKHIFEYKS